MNHKDKVAFFTSYISYMESNVNEKHKNVRSKQVRKPLIYKDFWHIFTKNSIFLNVDGVKFFSIFFAF